MAKRKKSSATAGDKPWSPEKYELEADLNALARAHAVEKDPERMKAAKDLAKEKIDENERKRDEAQHLVDLAKGEKEEE